VLAVHFRAIGITKPQIGLLATAFALGIASMALPAGVLVRKISARSVLVIALFSFFGCLAVFPFLRSLGAIAGVRFIDGASSACVWVSCETLLLERARPDNKAFVTSLYAMSFAIGYILGPILAKPLVEHWGSVMAFVAASSFALTGSFVAFFGLRGRSSAGAAAHEEAEGPSELGTWQILRRIKTSCFATFGYGYFQASVVLFLPHFLIEKKGIAESQTILVTAFFAAGMLLFSNYLGRMADKFGHLLVMRVLACIGTVMILGFVYLPNFVSMCAAVFVAGATLASISPISLALQGVVLPKSTLSRANAIYNVFYALGMLFGPPISSQLFTRFGGEIMLFHFAGLWLAFVLFTIVFAADDPARDRKGPATQRSAEGRA
jgi:MFS family permease